ncbi:unnamed protein product [Rhizophagus irregularis]|nr:unnamed protein product [Rhizophagus irregularis]
MLPNDDSRPYFINTSHFTGRICIRIKDFKGIAPSVQGRFKENNLTADDIVFGNDFDKKINLPFGSSLGLKILQYIDPGLQADIYSDEPWAYSPLVYTMNKINLYEEPIIKGDEWLPSWPSSNDFNDVAVTLPGFKLGVLQYWEGQPVRYVCKTRGEKRDSSIVFFVVVFQLVEEEDDNTITMSKSEDIKESNSNDVEEILPPENHPDIVNFTPKTGARQKQGHYEKE